MEGVLTKFNEIKESTIDPYFSEQVIKPFVSDLTAQYDFPHFSNRIGLFEMFDRSF